ncbi:hypothetical protein ACT7CN_26110 [Bacillus cereus]
MKDWLQLLAYQRAIAIKLLMLINIKKRLYYGTASKIAKALNEEVADLFDEHENFFNNKVSLRDTK